MKTKFRYLALSALAVGTLGLSSCVVDDGYYNNGPRYAYVEPYPVPVRPYPYRYGYGRGHYQGHRHVDADIRVRTGGFRGHSPRAHLHNAIFH